MTDFIGKSQPSGGVEQSVSFSFTCSSSHFHLMGMHPQPTLLRICAQFQHATQITNFQISKGVVRVTRFREREKNISVFLIISAIFLSHLLEEGQSMYVSNLK